MQKTIEPNMTLIAGDASDRTFFRGPYAKDSSAICMQFASWDGGHGGNAEDWLGMQASLKQRGLPVPHVFGVDKPNGRIWLEDLGDNFLNSKCSVDTPLDVSCPAHQQSLSYYKSALDLLIIAQYPDKDDPNPAQGRAFDETKLFYEINFFFHHFWECFLGQSSQTPLVKEVLAELQILCATLSQRPRVLCHRDYHARNLMVVGDRVVWIDFQDARMGPHTYDVVSLLRDSYTPMTWETRHFLGAYYCNSLAARRQELGMPSLDTNGLDQEFLDMGLQRNIKAMGSFGYLALQKHKPDYLQWIKPTLTILCAPQALKQGEASLLKKAPKTIEFLNNLAHGSHRSLLQNAIKTHTKERA